MKEVTAHKKLTFDQVEDLGNLPPWVDVQGPEFKIDNQQDQEKECSSKVSNTEALRESLALRYRLFNSALLNIPLRNDVDKLFYNILSPGYDMHGNTNYYGSLASSVLMKLCFMIKHYGSMYNRNNNWAYLWEAECVSVASTLLHQNRVLIQLPKIENGKDRAAEFLTKFLGISDVNRAFSTGHSIRLMPYPIMTHGGILKNLEEVNIPLMKSDSRADLKNIANLGLAGDYGLNLALGGHGNRDLFSKKTIDNRGGNGYLSLHYIPATQYTPGGLLIGIDQIAPMEFAPDIHDTSELKYALHLSKQACSGGVMRGRGSGIIPWRIKSDLPEFYSQFDPLRQGPDRENDSMFMHLSSEQLDHLFEAYDENSFDPIWLMERPSGYSQLARMGHDRLNAEYEGMVRLAQIESSKSARQKLPCAREPDKSSLGYSVSRFLFGSFWSAPSLDNDITESLTEAIIKKIRQ